MVILTVVAIPGCKANPVGWDLGEYPCDFSQLLWKYLADWFWFSKVCKVGLLAASAKKGWVCPAAHEFLYFHIFQSNMNVRYPVLMTGVNHVHVPQSLRSFVEQVTPQTSGVMCFQHLQYHGASSLLIWTGKLADPILTFSSIFCFTYLIYGILFILFAYRIALISLECLVHMHLSRPHCVYQELFFHLGCPCSCYAAVCWCEKRNPPAREGKSPAHLLIFCIVFWRLKA